MTTNDKYKTIVSSFPTVFNPEYSGTKYRYRTPIIECGEGWYIPIYNLCLQLENLNLMHKKRGVPIFSLQIKQKFGCLRFYYAIEIKPTLIGQILDWLQPRNSIRRKSPKYSRFVTDLYKHVDALVEEATIDCYQRCELCGRGIGNPESPRITTSGWLSNVCTQCNAANALSQKVRV